MNAEVVALLSAGLDGLVAGLDSVPVGDLLEAVAGRHGCQVQILVAPDVAASAGVKARRSRTADR